MDEKKQPNKTNNLIYFILLGLLIIFIGLSSSTLSSYNYESNIKLNEPNPVAQFHSDINQSQTLTDTWKNITWNIAVENESIEDFYIINESNNNESITINGFNGIIRVQGCVHPYNANVGVQDATIWLRVLVNGVEKRCLQSSRSKGFRGNGVDIIPYIGTVPINSGDEIVVQWRVDNINIEIRGDEVFDNPVSASVNFEKISEKI